MSECRECAKGFAIRKALAYTIKRGYHEEKEDSKGFKMIVCKDLLEEMFFGDFNWNNRRGITFAFMKEQWEKIKNWWDDIAPMWNYQIYRGHQFHDMKCLLKHTMWSAIGFPIQVVMMDGLVQFMSSLCILRLERIWRCMTSPSEWSERRCGNNEVKILP